MNRNDCFWVIYRYVTGPSAYKWWFLQVGDGSFFCGWDHRFSTPSAVNPTNWQTNTGHGQECTSAGDCLGAPSDGLVGAPAFAKRWGTWVFFAKVECLKIFGLCVLLVSATSIGCQPFWFWTVRGQPWLIFLEGFGLDPCHKTWVRATEAPNVCCHDNIETWSIPSQLSIRFLYWVCHASMILVAYWSEQMLEMRNDRDFIPSFNEGYGKAPWAQRFGSQV